MANYPYSIFSIADAHPGFANDPSIRELVREAPTFGISDSVVAGNPVDPHAVAKAEYTLKLLLTLRDCNPVITEPVIETAKNRAHLLRETHALLEFGLHPRVDALFLQAQFDQRSNQLYKRLEAMEEKVKKLIGD